MIWLWVAILSVLCVRIEVAHGFTIVIQGQNGTAFEGTYEDFITYSFELAASEETGEVNDTDAPSGEASAAPSTTFPTFAPSVSPSTLLPTLAPSISPTISVTTVLPTFAPSSFPTIAVTTVLPTVMASLLPSDAPSRPAKTITPTVSPSHVPSSLPSITGAPTSSGMPSSIPSYSPSSHDTLLQCPDVSFGAVQVLDFRYALEYNPEFEINAVIKSLEEDMNDVLASKLLTCVDDDDEATRKLQQDIGLVAIDSTPQDEMDEQAFCASVLPANSCVIIDGGTRIFLGPNANIDFAVVTVRTEIQNYLNSIRLLTGIYTTTYLSPDITSGTSSGIEDDGSGGRFGNGDGGGNQNDTPLSTRSTVLFSFAAVAFSVSVGVALWFKKSRHAADAAAADSEMSPRNIITNDQEQQQQQEHDDEERLSPFSKMLPAAYRLADLQDNADLGIILELQESLPSERNSFASNSILMSEGGYSTDSNASQDLIDMSSLRLLNTSQAPVLGAKKRKDGQGGAGDKV